MWIILLSIAVFLILAYVYIEYFNPLVPLVTPSEPLIIPSTPLSPGIESLTYPLENLKVPIIPLPPAIEDLKFPAEKLSGGPILDLVYPSERILTPSEKLLTPSESLLFPAETILHPSKQLEPPLETLLTPAEKLQIPAERIVPFPQKLIPGKEFIYEVYPGVDFIPGPGPIAIRTVKGAPGVCMKECGTLYSDCRSFIYDDIAKTCTQYGVKSGTSVSGQKDKTLYAQA